MSINADEIGAPASAKCQFAVCTDSFDASQWLSVTAADDINGPRDILVREAL